MKPILSQKAPRLDPGVDPIKEWQPAEHHLTHDGQVAFMARMKARMAAAQADANRESERLAKLRASVKPIGMRAVK